MSLAGIIPSALAHRMPVVNRLRLVAQVGNVQSPADNTYTFPSIDMPTPTTSRTRILVLACIQTASGSFQKVVMNGVDMTVLESINETNASIRQNIVLCTASGDGVTSAVFELRNNGNYNFGHLDVFVYDLPTDSHTLATEVLQPDNLPVPYELTAKRPESGQFLFFVGLHNTAGSRNFELEIDGVGARTSYPIVSKVSSTNSEPNGTIGNVVKSACPSVNIPVTPVLTATAGVLDRTRLIRGTLTR